MVVVPYGRGDGSEAKKGGGKDFWYPTKTLGWPKRLRPVRATLWADFLVIGDPV